HRGDLPWIGGQSGCAESSSPLDLYMKPFGVILQATAIAVEKCRRSESEEMRNVDNPDAAADFSRAESRATTDHHSRCADRGRNCLTTVGGDGGCEPGDSACRASHPSGTSFQGHPAAGLRGAVR